MPYVCTSERVESKRKRERNRESSASWRYARAMIINGRSFVHERIERRAAERISHSVRCEPQPHRSPIFFFLVDFVCGRARLPAPKRHSVSFLFFSSMTTKPFSSSSLFPSRSFFLSRAIFSPLNVKLHILFFTSAEFYDLPRYIYALDGSVFT